MRRSKRCRQQNINPFNPLFIEIKKFVDLKRENDLTFNPLFIEIIPKTLSSTPNPELFQSSFHRDCWSTSRATRVTPFNPLFIEICFSCPCNHISSKLSFNPLFIEINGTKIGLGELDFILSILFSSR